MEGEWVILGEDHQGTEEKVIKNHGKEPNN